MASSSSTPSSSSSSSSYTLSATLLHGSGTRDIAVESDKKVLVAEVNSGSVRVWDKKDPEGWTRGTMTHGSEKLHNGLCMVVASLRGAKGIPAGCYLSGGGDKRAILFLADGTRVGELHGHTNAVHSAAVSPTSGNIITGCWDGVAREWSEGKVCVRSFPEHKNGVVVLALNTGEIVTGGGDGDVCVYKGKDLVKRVRKAHDHVVRKLVPHPLGFASCANDGTLKVWSNQAELLLSFTAYGEDTKFVYGMTTIPQTNQMVTCDDGCTVKVWSQDGKLQQTIVHPAIVRAVAALPNGDFVSAGSDGMARIFSRDPTRFASVTEIQNFTASAQSEMQPMDVAGLPGEAELMKAGQKDGQVKIFAVQGKAMVYRWSIGDMKWVCVGQAMGAGRKKPKPKKTELDGKMYDHVTKVFITEQQSVMLGWNVDDDPRDVVDAFAALYSLPEDLKAQVYEFVAPKTDPNAIAARKAREKSERMAGYMRHVPNWTKQGFKLYSDTKKIPAMTKRIRKLAASDQSLTKDDQKTLAVLLANIENVSSYHTSPFSSHEKALLLKMLQWTGKNVLPALDACRVLMQHVGALEALVDEAKFKACILSVLRDPAASKHQLMLAIRVLANFVARRPRSEKERKEGKAPESIIQFVSDALDSTSKCVAPTADPGVKLSACVFLSNIVCWLGMNKIDGKLDLCKPIIEALCPLLLTPNEKPNAVYYALVAVASAGALGEDIKKLAASKVEVVPSVVGSAAQTTPAVKEALEDFIKVYSLS